MVDVAHPLFPLGRTVMTRTAQHTLNHEDVLPALQRHATGDWGDVDDHDRAANDLSLRDGSRLLSVYTDRNGTTFWIITEADRSSTCVLLPEDY